MKKSIKYFDVGLLKLVNGAVMFCLNWVNTLIYS